MNASIPCAPEQPAPPQPLICACVLPQLSLLTVRDHVGPSLKYVEFVLRPTANFKAFVEAADKVLEPIVPGGAMSSVRPL